ncbi:MAG: glycosyltransferase family 4 protein [Kiloniellales bacterium]|nr:glycosyltransferase family 4 protein [Kiloniellales bacterium]
MALREMSAALLGRLAGARRQPLAPPRPGGGMRVLLVSYEYPPLGGGGAKVVRGLATELVRTGHEVDVITTGWGRLPAESQDDGVRVTRLRTLRKRADRSTVLELGVWALRALPVVLRRLASERYHAINAHFILPDGLVCALAGTLLGKRFVVTAHGSDVPGYNTDRFQLAHRLLGRVWRRLVRVPDCIVFPSEHLMEIARRQDTPFKACVIPNGFNVRPRPARPAGARPHIVVATRLFPRKGVQHLIEAHGRLDEEVELHVIGDGPYRDPLEKLARQTGRPVVFHGWLENLSEPFNELMSTSGVFALPSEAENFPVCLLEAMAFELPIVTSSGTGCEAVVGDAGLLVPPGDVDALTEALRRLVRSPALRAELGQAGRQRLEDNFSWPAVARRYAALYAAHPASPPAAAPSIPPLPSRRRASHGVMPFRS